jgi:AcrR family transcriptional regulator
VSSEADRSIRRDPVRTRRALLDAAAEAVAAHGSGVSLETIARIAGVSKSGLLHHFSSKEELFAALADDAYARFELDVAAYTEPADLAPGRVIRGYLRATFASLGSHDSASDYWAVEAQLSVVPAVAEAIRANVAAWEERLTADGFDGDVMRLIVLAAQGAEALVSVGAHPGAPVDEVKDQLIRLTRRADELAALLGAAPDPDDEGRRPGARRQEPSIRSVQPTE